MREDEDSTPNELPGPLGHERLPDTGSSTLPALLGVSGVLAMTGGLLAREFLEDG